MKTITPPPVVTGNYRLARSYTPKTGAEFWLEVDFNADTGQSAERVGPFRSHLTAMITFLQRADAMSHEFLGTFDIELPA